MICKYCGAHYIGNKCDACGKVTPLMKRSTDIDILMSGTSPQRSPCPPRENTYERGIKEGYQKGLTEGYNNGYTDGAAALPSKNLLPMKLIAILCTTVFIISAVLSGYIFGKSGYNNGYEKGTLHGNEQGVETGIYIATCTYEPLLTEKYNAGLDQGRIDGYEEGYTAAKDEWIASTATASPTPSGSETPETPAPMPSYALDFPYSVTSNGVTKNPIVKKIQMRLRDLKYKVDGKTIDVDGLFGPNTEKAIKQFQKDNGLEDTGEVDLITYEHLFPEEQLPVVDNSSIINTYTFFKITTPVVPYLFTPPPVVQQTPTPPTFPTHEPVDNTFESTSTPGLTDIPTSNESI